MTPSDTASAKPPIWKRHTTLAAIVTATIMIVASCSGSEQSAAPSVPFDSGDGATLYQSNCASCHGADLRGTDNGPSHLSIVYEPNHHGDDSFRSAIINGAKQHHWNFGDMAAIQGLDDAQVAAIIGFVRSEQERQGFER